MWTLLGATALVAVGCTALINASNLWAITLHTAIVGVMLIAILRSIYREGARRAFWIGFSLFGWVYMILVYWVHYNTDFSDSFTNPYNSQLGTTRLLQLAYDELLPLVRTPPKNNSPGPGGGFSAFGAQGGGFSGGGPQSSGAGGGAFGGGTSPATGYPDQHAFMRVGQPLWTLLLALVGGWIARYLYHTRPALSA
jgi:uncharacterized membrane protein YgcG